MAMVWKVPSQISSGSEGMKLDPSDGEIGSFRWLLLVDGGRSQSIHFSVIVLLSHPGFCLGYFLMGERINDGYCICQSSNSFASISQLPCNTLKLLYWFALLWFLWLITSITRPPYWTILHKAQQKTKWFTVNRKHQTWTTPGCLCIMCTWWRLPCSGFCGEDIRVHQYVSIKLQPSPAAKVWNLRTNNSIMDNNHI